MSEMKREEIEEWRQRLSAFWLAGKTIKESQEKANALCDLALSALTARSDGESQGASELIAELEKLGIPASDWDGDEGLWPTFAKRIKDYVDEQCHYHEEGLKLDARSEGFREGVEAAARVCEKRAQALSEDPNNGYVEGDTNAFIWTNLEAGYVAEELDEAAETIRTLSPRETDESQETAVYIDGESGKSKRYELPTPRHPIRCKDSCAFPTFDLPCHGSCKLLASELPPPPERP